MGGKYFRLPCMPASLPTSSAWEEEGRKGDSCVDRVLMLRLLPVCWRLPTQYSLPFPQGQRQPVLHPMRGVYTRGDVACGWRWLATFGVHAVLVFRCPARRNSLLLSLITGRRRLHDVIMDSLRFYDSYSFLFVLVEASGCDACLGEVTIQARKDSQPETHEDIIGYTYTLLATS